MTTNTTLPIKPDNIPNPPDGFIYAGNGPIHGHGKVSPDIALWLNPRDGWDTTGNVGNSCLEYSLRIDSDIHKAQPWYRPYPDDKDIMLINDGVIPAKVETVSQFIQKTPTERLEAELDRRRKPRTITINGIEVPEPMRVRPELGQSYYGIGLGKTKSFFRNNWDDDETDNLLFERGLCHLTPESAIKHAEALISFTKQP